MHHDLVTLGATAKLKNIYLEFRAKIYRTSNILNVYRQRPESARMTSHNLFFRVVEMQSLGSSTIKNWPCT